LFEEVEARSRELSESLEQQTATSEVLGVISSSPGELEPVFQTMLANAARLCEANFGMLFRYDGHVFRAEAVRDVAPEFAEFLLRETIRPDSRRALGRLLETRAPIHIADMSAEPAYVEREAVRVAAVEIAGARTFLAVPMLKDDELLGAICIYRREVRPFTDKQIALVTSFANQAVIAIENVRLLNELRERTTELSESLEQETATSEILRVISSSPTNIQPVFDTIAQSAARLCKAQFCHVFRFDGALMYFAASHGLTPEGVEAMQSLGPLAPGRASAAARAILSGTVEEIPDVHADPDYGHRDTAKIINYRSIVAVPMVKQGRSIGTIAMARPNRTLSRLADQASQDLRRPRRHRHRERAIVRRGAGAQPRACRIAGAADGHGRRAQGHQPLEIRASAGARLPGRVGGQTLSGGTGSHILSERSELSVRCKLWLHRGA
jgi:GAF domain-containing protein